ncbi:integrase [Nostoc minutum NIES-26]|uniref:Integrase n=1 Tax=Nostoc minutum NIES-26 TaxID=1844469 RepID=A0A367QZS3_9NOSO|nr:integrase [Nostoc minutum NIES-26]
MNMIRKGQVKGVEKGDIGAQVKFVAQIFSIVA